jgi:hypothetical protein
MKELRDQGMWWLPGHENSPVAGTLITANDEFPRLELIGALRELQFAMTDSAPEIILGVAGGHFVTLYKCVLSGTNIRAPGLYTEQYVANFVLRGAHFVTASEIVFDKVAIEYDALFEWAGISGLRSQYHTNAKGHLESINAEFRFPESVAFDIGGAMVTIESRAEATGLGFTSNLELTQTVAFVVAPAVPLQLEEYLTRYLHDLANFLSLAVGKPVRTLNVVGTLPPVNNAESERPREVEIHFLNRDRFVDGDKRRWDMLFTLPAIRPVAQQAMRRWFERAESLRSIYDLYFGTLFQRGAYVHQRFLSLAQALESYHRQVKGGHHVSEEVFQPLRDRLVNVISQSTDAVSRDARQAFCNKLAYFNEISLRRRLKELVSSHRPYVRLLIRNERRFVKRVVATRNYYTHYDVASAAESVPVEHLHYLSDQMQFLLELCLLSELGFDQDTIANLANGHQRYLEWAQMLASFDPAT